MEMKGYGSACISRLHLQLEELAPHNKFPPGSIDWQRKSEHLLNKQ